MSETSGSRDPKGRRLSRRGFLIATGAAVVAAGAVAGGVEEEVLPGRSWLYRHLHLDGPDGALPQVRPGPTVSGSFVSTARLGRRCGWTVAYPPGQRRDLPVAVVLHGRSGDHTSAFDHDSLALDLFLAAAVADGVEPFALASVDGGDTYWHARDSGEDAGAMVTDEFIPLLADRGLRTDRLGLFGWSMGGFGALHLAQQLGPRAVAGVSVLSPALFHEYADATPGAFDDATDLSEVTVLGRQDELAGIPVRVDCGEGDPFYGAVRDYVAGFAEPPEGGFELGDHDVGYWRRMAPRQLSFLGAALEGAGSHE